MKCKVVVINKYFFAENAHGNYFFCQEEIHPVIGKAILYYVFWMYNDTNAFQKVGELQIVGYN